ncbi:MAG TPA: methanogen output domain 1-containing protein, partial [Methanobacterium sp.]
MSKIKIIIVEDESIVAMDIKHRAEGLGYQVIGVTPSGEEALEMVRENPPDLILMDIVLKGKVDGIEAAQRIHDNFDIPVLYLTAYSDEETLKRAKITEPFGYIIKPFEDRELHSSVEIAIYKHEMDRKLKESEKWLSTTLESIGDAVIATDKEGVIIFMNPVARKVTGWDQGEAIGKTLLDVFQLINEDTGIPLEDPVTKVLKKGAVIEMNDPALLIAKNGTRLPIDDSSAPIRDENGSVIGVALVFRDITERKRAEKEREELLKDKARGELSNFVLSALPVFASNIPPQVRDNIARSFSDRFEKNMQGRFQEDLKDCLDTVADTPDNIFRCYIAWLRDFFSNLGIDTEITSQNGSKQFKFHNCPWVDDSDTSPMFCMICR